MQICDTMTWELGKFLRTFLGKQKNVDSRKFKTSWQYTKQNGRNGKEINEKWFDILTRVGM